MITAQMSVVHFNQHLSAAHSKSCSKPTFLHFWLLLQDFLMLNIQNTYSIAGCIKTLV